MVLKKRFSRQGSQPTTAAHFTESTLYKILFMSSVEEVAANVKKAIYTDDENIHLKCPDSGRTYLHIIAEMSDKFSDPRALPAAYQLCYAGIDVSAQATDTGNTALHDLVCRPNTHRLILMLLRYGVDVTLRNAAGKTADEILVMDKPEGHSENLHWYRKLAPGLRCGILGSSECESVDSEHVERLLKGWCRVNNVTVYVNGKPSSLLQFCQMRAKDILLAETLKKYSWTNDFVHATLAGLPDEMKRLYKEAKKKMDIDTKDHSYQYDTSSPDVPQPLIAAAWEQSNFSVIDVLVELGVDVCNTYSNQLSEINAPKPLFYQTLMGVPRVNDLNIMLRILENADLRCKTEFSTTFLHESVKYNLPAQFVSKLLLLGVQVEDFESNGHTARDLANQLGYTNLVKVLDSYVMDIAKRGDVKALENLVLQCYDIGNVQDVDGRTLVQLAESKELPSKINKFILKAVPEMMTQMKELWSSVDRNDLALLKKYLTTKDLKRVVLSRDRCGRTILLMAILNKNKEAIKLILKKQPHIIEYFDNNMLTCLHYAYIIFEDDYSVSELLIANGASLDWCCTKGKSAYFTRKDVASESDFYNSQEFIKNYGLYVFANKTTFEPSIIQAIQAGDITQVKSLIDTIRPYGSINLFSHVVFDAIDAGQEEVAIYLLQHGCDKDIVKQYDFCNPDNELCAMQECCHPSSTILERARLKGQTKLVAYLTPYASNGSHATQYDNDDVHVMEGMDTSEPRATDNNIMEVTHM